MVASTIVDIVLKKYLVFYWWCSNLHFTTQVLLQVWLFGSCMIY